MLYSDWYRKHPSALRAKLSAASALSDSALRVAYARAWDANDGESIVPLRSELARRDLASDDGELRAYAERVWAETMRDLEADWRL